MALLFILFKLTVQVSRISACVLFSLVLLTMFDQYPFSGAWDDVFEQIHS